MAYLFPSDAWVKAWMDAINQDANYTEIASHWEGDVAFVIEPSPPYSLTRPVTLYTDLWHGKCRQAFEVIEPDGLKPAFTFTSRLDTWKKVIDGELEPVQGLMVGKLKLKGNLVVIMRNIPVTLALVKTLAAVDTKFPI